MRFGDFSNTFAGVRHLKHLHRNRLSETEFTTERNVLAKFQQMKYSTPITFLFRLKVKLCILQQVLLC